MLVMKELVVLIAILNSDVFNWSYPISVQCFISIPPENVRKPGFLTFPGEGEGGSGQGGGSIKMGHLPEMG